jgi:ATP-binding cassette, subfamily C (CFTR/MRP), member 1
VIIVTVCVLIGLEMGVSVALAAALCCLFIMSYAVINSRAIGLVRHEILAVAGERMQVTNEVLQGIRVVKLYAWEASVKASVDRIRAHEIQLIRKYDYMRINNTVMLRLGQTVMTAACLLAYVYIEHKILTIPTAFTLPCFSQPMKWKHRRHC